MWLTRSAHLFAVAAAGFILQGGVLALAGVGVWIFQWDLNTGYDPTSTDYAPIMFIIGTVLMCSGMWGCAALIGQTTHEIHYKRQFASKQATRLLWLQHGEQVIGDQSFDSFAYFEDKSDPIKVRTSSRKDLNEKFELYTFFAVSAVLVGYIMRFGLSGLKAWISLAQLGSTVIMSILRGFLRMQRLGRSANKLRDMPDFVTGSSTGSRLSLFGKNPSKYHLGTLPDMSRLAKSRRRRAAQQKPLSLMTVLLGAPPAGWQYVVSPSSSGDEFRFVGVQGFGHRLHTSTTNRARTRRK